MMIPDKRKYIYIFYQNKVKYTTYQELWKKYPVFCITMSIVYTLIGYSARNEIVYCYWNYLSKADWVGKKRFLSKPEKNDHCYWKWLWFDQLVLKIKELRTVQEGDEQPGGEHQQHHILHQPEDQHDQGAQPLDQKLTNMRKLLPASCEESQMKKIKLEKGARGQGEGSEGHDRKVGGGEKNGRGN